MENVIKWKTTLTKTRVPEKKPLTRAQTWDYYYQVAVYYYNKNKNLNLKRRDTVLDENGLEVKLGNWLQIQRSRRSAGSLSPSQIQKLDDIKMPWKTEMSKKENYSFILLKNIILKMVIYLYLVVMLLIFLNQEQTYKLANGFVVNENIIAWDY